MEKVLRRFIMHAQMNIGIDHNKIPDIWSYGRSSFQHVFDVLEDRQPKSVPPECPPVSAEPNGWDGEC